MLDWNEYIEQLLSRESSFDGISLSIGDATKPVGVPPIIKASVLMLDRMLECQGKFNILVLCFGIFCHCLPQSIDITDDCVVEVAQLGHIIGECRVEALLGFAFPHAAQGRFCL